MATLALCQSDVWLYMEKLAFLKQAEPCLTPSLGKCMCKNAAFQKGSLPPDIKTERQNTHIHAHTVETTYDTC